MPQRIQRKRTKGWRMPEGAVYVGRPTKWGNPFRPSDYRLGAVTAVARFASETARRWQHTRKGRAEIEELRGKDLACWCSLDQPCHADVLLELANAHARHPARELGPEEIERRLERAAREAGR